MSSFTEFLKHKQGSIVPIAALAMGTLLSVSAIAFEYSTFYQKKTALQDVADSASLAAAQEIALGGGPEKARVVAKDMFEANKTLLGLGEDTSVEVKITGGEKKGYKVGLDIKGDFETSFSQFVGIKELSFDTNSVAEVGSSNGISSIEVVMVADVSDSMVNRGHFDELKVALRQFVGAVFADKDYYNTRRMSLIPYAETVNFGSQYKQWLPEDIKNDPTIEFQGCFFPEITEPISDDAAVDLLEDAGRRPKDVFGKKNGKNGNCPGTQSEVVLFENRPNLLKSRISGLTVTGGTATDIGLMWGYRALHPSWRGKFYASSVHPKDFSSKTQKFLIVLTDGSAYRADPNGDGIKSDKDTEMPRENFIKICNVIKSDSHVNLYAIGYGLEGKDNAMKNALENCHGGLGRYFDANSANIDDVFKTLSFDVNQVRLIK